MLPTSDTPTLRTRVSDVAMTVRLICAIFCCPRFHILFAATAAEARYAEVLNILRQILTKTDRRLVPHVLDVMEPAKTASQNSSTEASC